MTLEIPRRQYAALYGPTTGDRIRLADTELLIEIERDLTTPATSRSSPLTLPSRTGSRTKLAPLKPASSPIWSCGNQHSLG